MGCRFCYVTSLERDRLDLDLSRTSRYHHQIVKMRAEIRAAHTNATRERYGTKYGMDTGDPALIQISPALDIVLSRPGDPAHSEYSGMSKQLHLLLVEAILTVQAAKAYATVLRQWPFPPDMDASSRPSTT